MVLFWLFLIIWQIEALFRQADPFNPATSSFFSHPTEGCRFLCLLFGVRQPKPKKGGKIERWFKTVGSRFIPHCHASTLAELNTALECWLTKDYEQKVHRATGQTPFDRFTSKMHCLRSAPANLKDYFRWARPVWWTNYLFAPHNLLLPELSQNVILKALTLPVWRHICNITLPSPAWKEISLILRLLSPSIRVQEDCSEKQTTWPGEDLSQQPQNNQASFLLNISILQQRKSFEFTV